VAMCSLLPEEQRSRGLTPLAGTDRYIHTRTATHTRSVPLAHRAAAL
jgi:hypothetical protein